MLPEVTILAKRFYVALAKGLGALLRNIGVLGWLDRHSSKRCVHWVRSLFAIYDVDQMISLDVPWWTYRAIDRMDTFLKAHPGAKVFEYGSGASTIWLARRAASVHSIEHDKPWFDLMRSRITEFDGVTLDHVPVDEQLSTDTLFHSQKEGYGGKSFKAYVTAISNTKEPYDVIVIDGRARAACLHVAQAHLADGGIIVFDNTKRNRYDVAILNSDLSASALPGLSPSLPYPDKTTLLRAKPFKNVNV